ncbi:MAG: hypothetical protein E7107_11760 [Prevotella sp.]|jgi:prophage antirepressor-like protein|nr:hypothetical protein [Prevotella sp.]
MTQKHKIQIFEDKKVRTAWDDELEEWFFSVVDVCGVLTEQKTARGASTYWAVLKTRLSEEGADEVLTNCKQLKMRATDGKMRFTDAADAKTIFRIIQSIPSKKAEPFKRWMAEVAAQRLESQLGHSVISPAKAADYLPPAEDVKALPENGEHEKQKS